MFGFTKWILNNVNKIEILFHSISLALPLVVTIIFVMTKLALVVESQSMKVFKILSGFRNYHQTKGRAGAESFIQDMWEKKICICFNSDITVLYYNTQPVFTLKCTWRIRRILNCGQRMSKRIKKSGAFIFSGLPTLRAGWWAGAWEGDPVHLCLPLPHATTVAKFQIFWKI